MPLLKKRKSNVIRILIRYGKEVFDNFKKYVGGLTTVFDVSELRTRLKKNLNGIITPSSRSKSTSNKSTKR